MNRLEIKQTSCSDGHKYPCNRFISKRVKDLCVDCHGSEWVLNSILKKLNGRAERLPMENLRKASEVCPNYHSPLNIKYQFICEQNHVWTSSLANVRSGRWCVACLESSTTFNDDLNDILKRKGITMIDESYNNLTRPVEYECREHHNVTTNLIDLIYTETCHPRFTELIMTPFSELSNEDITSAGEFECSNIYVIKEVQCKIGHVFRTAPFLLDPRPWCSDVECDSLRVLNTILKNVGGTASYHNKEMNYIENDSSPDIRHIAGKVNFKCSEGHVFAQYPMNVIDGMWCDECLEKTYSTVESCKSLAKTFNGYYRLHKGDYYYFCKNQCKLSYSTAEILRGKRCHSHKECIAIGFGTQIDKSKLQSSIDRMQLKYKLMKEISTVDLKFEITFETWKKYINRYYLYPSRSIFLLAKFNTFLKVKQFAQTRGGDVDLPKAFDQDNKFIWACGTEHLKGIKYQWTGKLLPILEGRWCPVCSDEYIIAPESKEFRSRGSVGVENYLREKCWNYEREKTFPNCTYKRRLRFDFYVPHLNLLIEFDGDQHFRSVSIFNGEDGFKELLVKDHLKGRFCVENKIRLLRVRRSEWVKEDLDKLLLMDDDLVLFINNPTIRELYRELFITPIDNSYFALKLK